MCNPITSPPIEPIAVWLAAAAFAAGGIANATGHPKIRASFTNLGFPGWWCWVTAVLELVTAGLLLPPAGRLIGIALGSCIMAAAIAAIVARRLYRHLPPPVLFLFLLALAGLGHAA
ncbi:DoxX family protein [Sphingomonas sp. CGMCC 1.13654]|uniref:DoxX family protein n=1 Tax=Sphingomonas chungangi TaxID=2683589 RepID=A0A838L333_9SPHN|nr:DoxX family protein [Sphingomonas chungangi]MBA2933903.1 DoxX family protein [Sphingomonas chungangi]MVW55232.1 hypothetical protein [Sphingomonas chungangi]